jgi:hypothetical protein
MKKEWHNEKCGWIILTDNKKYNVSEQHIQNFICLLGFMIKRQQIRIRKEKACPG